MEFEWDESKRLLNIRRHALDFRDVVAAFDLPMLVALDSRMEYGEDRWIGMGIIKKSVVVIAFTERGEGTVRIISARKATRHEREAYAEKIQD